MSTLSVFDAAREAPERAALLEAGVSVTFAELARRCRPHCAALLGARPAALALTPRATVDSLLWLYAALATGTPVLTLHQRATAAEREHARSQVSASEPPPLEQGEPEPILPAAIDPAAPLAFIPTSGSTGTPRLVELSRGAMQASARASAANLGWQDDDCWLLCLPLAHTGGLSIVIRCLLARRSVALFEPGHAGLLAEMAELGNTLTQATLLSVVPSLLERLLDVGFTPGTRLRAVLVGGSGCSPMLARRAHAARVPLLTSYGLTETASQVVTRRYAERFEPLPERDGCVSSGHALGGVELTLRDELVALRSPTLLTRYVGSDRPTDADGWLLTTDRAQLGETGELYVRGRADDVIVTAGENVDPLEVEAALLSLPRVTGACVLGTASERFGAVVSALLVTADASLSRPERLAELLVDRLARHKQPRLVRIVESLPLTASGKVDRRACARLFAADQPLG